jgi:1-acyl-sn-glycerol-3-phosphate acyltransferase
MNSSTALGATLRAGSRASEAPMLHRMLRGPVRAVVERWFGLRVEGVEHLPVGGAYIVAANHHNYLDGVVLSLAMPEPISFLVMPRVWRASPFHPALHRHFGSIPLGLDRPDVGALREALAALARGRVVGIFPEGPFSAHGRLERGRPGVGLLALRSGVPVIPAGIRGTYEALAGRRFYVPRRRALAVRFGPPRVFGARDGDARMARRHVTQRIMGDIAALVS